MLSNRRFWKKLFLALLGVALLVAPMLAPTLQAQVASTFLQITDIDASAFPDVSVTVYGQGLEGGLADAEILLREDGAPREIGTNEMVDVGVQIALVVDTYAAIGTQRLQQVGEAVGDLTQSGRLLDGKDYLSAIAYDLENSTPEPKVLVPWSIDHQGVINNILGLQPNPAHTKTPLIQQIFFALEQFSDSKIPANLQRHIVVFSDGVDLLSGTAPEDLPRIASSMNVRVHTVWLGTGGTAAANNMRRIALLTGGENFTLNAQDPIPTNVWDTIQATQSQRVITYRSDNPNPQVLTVSANGATGALLNGELRFPAIRILPAKIEVLSPANGTVTRSGPAWDTPVNELMPSTLAGQIEISWPDGRGRGLTVEYQIDGKILDGVQVTPDGNRLNLVLPIADLDVGRHTFRVRLTDELGIISDSSPVTLNVVVDKPAPPPTPNVQATATAIAGTAVAIRATDQAAAALREANIQATAEARATEQAAVAATAAAQAQATADTRATTAAVSAAQAQATADAKIEEQATSAAIAQAEAKATVEAQATASAAEIQVVKQESDEQVRTLSVFSMISTALGLAALVFAVIAWRNPRVRKRATEIVSGTIQAVTEPFFGPRGGGPPSNAAKARLTLVSGDPSMSQSIEIYKEVTKIGRDAALADVVINDRRVSRYHCQIKEERGGFRLLDEGSTSGTWVNDRQVDMSGALLQSGDEINFGPIRYKFVLTGGSNDQTLVGYTGTMGEQTEPYVSTVRGSQTTQGSMPGGGYGQTDYDNATQIDMSNINPADLDSTSYMTPGEDDDSENRLPDV